MTFSHFNYFLLGSKARLTIVIDVNYKTKLKIFGVLSSRLLKLGFFFLLFSSRLPPSGFFVLLQCIQAGRKGSVQISHGGGEQLFQQVSSSSSGYILLASYVFFFRIQRSYQRVKLDGSSQVERCIPVTGVLSPYTWSYICNPRSTTHSPRGLK